MTINRRLRACSLIITPLLLLNIVAMPVARAQQRERLPDDADSNKEGREWKEWELVWERTDERRL